MVKFSRLAKYHAAEHQTVHAMERHEILTTRIVARMPRVHPRCGTNITAGGMIFSTVSGVTLPYIGYELSGLIAVFCAIMGWRRLGAMLQHWVTTSPPGENEIESGIKAASELQQKFYSGEESPGRLKRIWNLGLIQNSVGIATVIMIYGIYEISIIRILGI